MKVAPHVVRLYVKTSRRYRKLVSKLGRNTLTTYQRNMLLHQLRKLVDRLRRLHVQLKIAAATGTVVLLLNVGQAMAQKTGDPSTLGPFTKHNRLKNPLREPIFTGEEPALAIVDLDGDGDMDVVVGEYNYGSNDHPAFGGYLRYFENHSAQGTPLYLELKGEENPFEGIQAVTAGVAPALADIDGDGDLDLFLGQSGWPGYDASPPGGVEYYRNDNGIYSKQTGAWDPVAKAGNPFDGLSLGNDVRPVFVDFDKDGDQDVIIGSYQYSGPPDYGTYIHYLRNDGSGNFTPSPITVDVPLYVYRNVSPAVADLDHDGDHDIVLGAYGYPALFYLNQVTPGNFVVQSGPWDPSKGTGNPFDGFQVGENASPAFVDFDGDGHLDLFVADEPGAMKYSDNIIRYYRNSGADVFEEKVGLDNPFGGVVVERYASPVLLDLDADGQFDALVGNKYDGGYTDENTGQWIYTYSSLRYYKNTEGRFAEAKDGNTLKALEVNGYFAPQFVDIDGDGDLDIISGNDYGRVVIFRNAGGEYVKEMGGDPFVDTRVEYNASAKLADIDSDGDLDLFMGNGSGDIAAFRNDDGQFVEQVGADNPLDFASAMATFQTPFPAFVDIDHDGDLDVFFGAPNAYQAPSELVYFENTGTPEQPRFETPVAGMFPGVDGRSPQAFFIDYDGDGDLDSFVGNYDGTVAYLENENPAVLTTFASPSVTYEPGMDDPVVVAPDLVLSDTDDDRVVKALVTIVDYESGEKLSFTPHDGITGYFDVETGTLYFNGASTRAIYEGLLRTVTFEVPADKAGRKGSVQSTTVREVNFAVYDSDFTTPQPAAMAVNVFVNSPPDIGPDPVINATGFRRVINLMEITSDADDNLDPNLFVVVSQPSSGAKASIEFVSPEVVNLVIDYEGIGYAGLDEVIVRACDDAGACTERILLLEVDVDSGIVVYNAVAPNSSGDNRFMRISGLPASNTVRVFNRWGDKVFEVDNYGSAANGNVFRGQNDNGAALPSGTYFYTIESQGKKRVSGYLTLKQ